MSIDPREASECNLICETVAYVVPEAAWAYWLEGEGWRPAVSKPAVMEFLSSLGVSDDSIKTVLNNEAGVRMYKRVHGSGIEPNKGRFFERSSNVWHLNNWVRPSLVPERGSWPTIQQILSWLCDHDDDAVMWLCNWVAFKIQNPGIVPKVSVILSGSPGSGKETLARMIFECLGPHNCAKISRKNLENRFNARWAGKLFVFADEVMTRENSKDVSQDLKILIDSPTIEFEGKGRDQVEVKNRSAWLFGSNDIITPLAVERGDRRYTIFSNHRPITDEYRALLKSCFVKEEDRATMVPEFRRELSAFYDDMLHWKVDFDQATSVYENQARKDLISVSAPGHEKFILSVADHGIDGLIEQVLNGPDGDRWQFNNDRERWDFGHAEGWLSSEMVMACYLAFCRSENIRATVTSSALGKAVANHPAGGWEYERHRVPKAKDKKNNERAYYYKVPRAERPVTVVPKPADVTTKVANP